MTRAVDYPGMTAARVEMLRLARASKDGNPWPLIGIQQRRGGAKHRLFAQMQRAGYFHGQHLSERGRNIADRLHREGAFTP